jgi:hypothetical protein
MTIPVLERNQVPLPPAGFYSLFFDQNNANLLTQLDSQGIFTVLPDQPFDPLTVSQINDCICDIVEKSNTTLSCSAGQGIITMADYQAWFDSINLHGNVIFDPSTGSTQTSITTSPRLFISLTTTNVLCNGDATGTAAAIVTGGTAPYTIVYTDFAAAPADPSILTAGSYTLTVTDAQNFQEVRVFVITEPPLLVVGTTIVADSGGGDGKISANVTGGTIPYTYEWRDNIGTPIGQTTQTAINLVAATYQVEVTDANGCIELVVGIVVP